MAKKVKLNKVARSKLKIAYGAMAKALDAIADLEVHYIRSNDEARARRFYRAAEYIMSAQAVLNPLAEDEDIRLV